jgi:hypothetical protein
VGVETCKTSAISSTVTVEKRPQLIENTLEPGWFFMKLRRPKGVGDNWEVIRAEPKRAGYFRRARFK